MLTISNVPDQVHRGLRMRAAQPGHGMEAEVRASLESAVGPQGPVKLGSRLANVGRQAKLSDQGFAVFEQIRDMTPAHPVGFES